MRKQLGVTTIGWIILLIPMALTLYTLIRVGPVYLNYWRIVDAMQKTASEYKSEELINPTAIRDSLAKRFDVSYVDKIEPQDISIKKGDAGWEMTADYEGSAPLFANILIVIAFNKTVVIR
jgi:hypothetical protein